MAEKVLLRDNNENVILPITRGELVLDSEGQVALRSELFLANDSSPGITSLHYVKVSSDTIQETSSEEVPIIQLKSSSENVYPITSSDAVVVQTDSGTNSLTNTLREIRVEVNNSKIILDERPTEGNTTHSVSSDGIFQELKETVGNIQILLQSV